MSESVPLFDRFVALAKRELHADDVRMLPPGEVAPEADNAVVVRLADGRHVVASFTAPPSDREVVSRRLSMLASTFSDAATSQPSDRPRPPVASSLHDELKVLAARARALDAVVIDKDSPVVWGSASVPALPRARNDLLLRDMSARELSSLLDERGSPDGASSPAGASSPDPAAQEGVRLRAAPVAPAESSVGVSGADDEEDDAPVEGEEARHAIGAVRALPALEGLHRGGHLRHVERDDGFYLALSFSGIYILCLVFDGAFDELRAERAVAEALPRIERLVLAIPPLDPDPPQPMGGVVALRRGRRR